MKKRIALLGSTGSIGVNTLKVVAALKERFEIVALSADSNIKLLAGQANIFRPRVISVRDEYLSGEIRLLLRSGIKVLYGSGSLDEIVSRADVDTVVFAISGTQCLKPLLTAIRNKKEIALANKEALVSAGSFVMALAKKNGVRIVPVDSEHSAIFQCLEGRRSFLRKIYLTASGGPLLHIPKNRFDNMTPKFILKHPKWSMGRKISVDSATMMNKALEIIEAKWLFGMDESDIDVLIHPEAIIHSMVEFLDGAILAQMSSPDMRIPIQYAITYPGRLASQVEGVNFAKVKNLSFEKPDAGKFPCLHLARVALEKGGTACAVLNAADEEAVKQYLEGRIKFTRIPFIIEKVLSLHKTQKADPSIEAIFDAESWAREEIIRLCYH